jgi:transposase InsO family protein
MVWQSGSVMDKRLEFVRLAQAGGVSISELCRRFGISREAGHKFLRRYREEGIGGLRDRSRRPHASPVRTPEAMEQQIVVLRRQHAWGGRKIARRLRDLGVENVPAASTITAVLRRHDALQPLAGAAAQPARRRFERAAPNQLWQMDFKGDVILDHGRCHPLSVLDDHSRFLLGLFACAAQTAETVRSHLTALFRRYGLPEVILCDNGSPWGASDPDAFTDLEVWLLRLSVRMHHGRPYHPQTQGKDERLHRTLVVECLQGRRIADLAACQPLFEQFRSTYNTIRPHEALDMAVPLSRYQASARAFPEVLALPHYHAADLVRRVHHDGAVSLLGRRVKLSQAFRGLDVAFRPSATDGIYTVWFMRFAIAAVDLRQDTVVQVHRLGRRRSQTTPLAAPWPP